MKIQLKVNITLVEFIRFNCNYSIDSRDITKEDYIRLIPIYLKYCYSWVELNKVCDLVTSSLLCTYTSGGYYEVLGTKEDIETIFNIKGLLNET